MLSIHILADKRKVPEVGTTADLGNSGARKLRFSHMPTCILDPNYPIGEFTRWQYATDCSNCTIGTNRAFGMFGTCCTITELMKRMPVSQARKAFPDLVNKAFYAGETTIVTRRGKGDVAAIIPMRLLGIGSTVTQPKPTQRKPSESAPGRLPKPPIKLLS